MITIVQHDAVAMNFSHAHRGAGSIELREALGNERGVADRPQPILVLWSHFCFRIERRESAANATRVQARDRGRAVLAGRFKRPNRKRPSQRRVGRLANQISIGHVRLLKKAALNERKRECCAVAGARQLARCAVAARRAGHATPKRALDGI
jgi:hypothetical protein